MIYFDNAATGGKKPDTVLTAVNSAIRVCANPGRSGHKLSLSCLRRTQECRNALSEYFGGYGFERVVFTKNCTEALNLALFGLLNEGDKVLTTCMEHNSVLRPLKHLEKTKNVRLDICPLVGGEFSLAEFKNRVSDGVKAVVITSASNVTGAIPPLKKLRAILPKKTLLIVDGAQGGGHIPLSMQELGIDALALAGHKGLFGIQGSGALLFSDRVELAPLLYGGTGTMSLSLDMPEYFPESLEAGTLSFPAILSLLEGVRHLSLHDERIRETLLNFTAYFIDGLKKLKNYRIYSAPNPAGIVGFSHRTLPSERVASILSAKYGIAVRGGLHCAPLMHEALGTLDGGLIRVSFSHFNTKTELDECLSALLKIDENFSV